MPTHVTEFLGRMTEGGHELIVPETTALEFDREQAKARDRLIADLDSAAATLTKNGINVPSFQASDYAGCHTLDELLGTVTDLRFSIMPAVMEDYRGALQRACYKLSPHPPEEQSDEMRDLVIWETSIRYARENAGALLISRDKVHVHYRGDMEARDAGLLRAKDFERALEILMMETVSGQQIRKLLMTQWGELIKATDALSDGAQLILVRNPYFSDRGDGVTEVSAELLMSSGVGKELTAESRISFQDEILLQFEAKFSGQALNIEFAKPVTGRSYLDDLDELKDALGER